jgi:tRNA (guanosine-2'-O-)-methyltransferase
VIAMTHNDGEASRGMMDAPELLAAIATHGADTIADRLAPLLTPSRRARIEAVLCARVASLQVAIEAPQDPHNAAAVVRTAEALGAGTVHVIAGSTRVRHSRRVMRGTVYWADTREHADWDGFVAALPTGMRRAGACVEATSVELAAVPVDRPLCLVFGNEQAGLSTRARADCELHFRIPMVGMAESLNLSVAAGIALHALLERRRAALGAAGDLSGQEVAERRARWYAKAVDPRLARHALGLPVETTREQAT